MDELQKNVPPSYPVEKKEWLFGIGILLSALVTANAVFAGGFNLGFAVGVCLCVLVSGGYLLASGCKGKAYALSLLALSLVLGASFARSDDAFVKFVTVCFLLVSVNLGLCLLAGKNRFPTGGVSSLTDAVFTVFTLGFGEMPVSCRGITNAVRFSGPAGKKGASVLLGLGLALPVLLIIVPLLMQADAAFEGLLQQLPEFDLPEFLATLVFGPCLGFVLFTRNTALKYYVNPPAKVTAQKGLSHLTVNTVLAAVCLVYGVYLASQLAYFVGGFSGILPEEFTLAQYARRGFFEMAWLCAINLAVMVFSLSICSKKDTAPLSTRLLCLFIGIVTLFLVAAASAKMLLYIESYGLTRLRVLTQVVMVFLALVTALVCVWLFARKFPYMKVVLLCALVICGAVSWADVDTQVARYNVSAYLDGRMETVDVSYLNGLGDGVVPQIARLAQEARDPKIVQAANTVLENRWASVIEDYRIWNYVNHAAAKFLPVRPQTDAEIADRSQLLLGIHFPNPQPQVMQDSHGGFQGDGLRFEVSTFAAYDGEKIISQLESSQEWQPLPLSEPLNTLLYGYSTEGYSYRSPLITDGMDMPQVENGYCYFYDRHAESSDPYEADAVFDRASYNLTLALYDTDTHTLYYWELDT